MDKNPRLNFTLQIDVNRADVLKLAQEWAGDSIVEVLETKWAEIGDNPGGLPLDLANAFDYITRNVLAATLTSKLLYPDDDDAAQSWALHKFGEALFSLSHAHNEPEEDYEGEFLTDRSVANGLTIQEVIESRFGLWEELLEDTQTTPIILVTLDSGGGMDLISANDMTAEEILEALSQLTLFMVEQALKEDGHPNCEHLHSIETKGRLVCVACGAIGSM